MSAALAASLQLLSAVDKDFLSNETTVSTGAPRVKNLDLNSQLITCNPMGLTLFTFLKFFRNNSITNGKYGHSDDNWVWNPPKFFKFSLMYL